MMNKMEEQQETKKTIWQWIILLILGITLTICFGWLINSMITDWHNYNTYKDFCSDKPSICYCSGFLICEFKTSSSQHCLNGNCSEYILDKNTIELCKIAKELNDKEIMFKVGCE